MTITEKAKTLYTQCLKLDQFTRSTSCLEFVLGKYYSTYILYLHVQLCVHSKGDHTIVEECVLHYINICHVIVSILILLILSICKFIHHFKHDISDIY